MFLPFGKCSVTVWRAENVAGAQAEVTFDGAGGSFSCFCSISAKIHSLTVTGNCHLSKEVEILSAAWR